MRETISPAQRRHLCHLAELVNSLGAEQHAAATIVGNMRRGLQQLRTDQRTRSEELEGLRAYEQDSRYHPKMKALSDQLLDIAMRIRETDQRIARHEATSTLLTESYAPLRRSFMAVCEHLGAAPSELGWVETSRPVEETTILSGSAS